ncbi:MAG: amidohydrolase family protein [Saprospiraceae bacterium]|nr:amidohydrolase family protein [Saprospiraceae bacterium]
MTEFKRINAHGHLLPKPGDIPAFMKERKLFWVDDDRKFMRQGDWKRPITDPSFFLEEKLEWMLQNNIDHEVLITLSQLYCNGLSKQVTEDIIRFQNDFHAQIQNEHASKFTCGFVVQPAFIDQALAEIERAVNTLDLQLLCLPTHYQNKDGDWISSADQSTEPIFELANELGLAIEIHPYDAPKMIQLKDQFWRFHLIWMCAQTADHYHMFTLLDFPNRYPNVRTCYAHGNQFGQVNIGRRMQGFNGRPDLFEGAQNPRESLGASNVYFDTLVHDVDSLELLIRRQGIKQVVVGLDDPYPLGEMESVPDSYPGKVIDDALKNGVIKPEDVQSVWKSNIERWLNRAIV